MLLNSNFILQFALYYFALNRVSDEKDARGYLQALATKMSKELESLKVSGPSGGSGAAVSLPFLFTSFCVFDCIHLQHHTLSTASAEMFSSNFLTW